MQSASQTFCSDIAREHRVPLMGTATRGDVWFLIEYPYRWEPKAFEQSQLSQEVKDHLKAAEQEGVKLRIQMIKQSESLARDHFHFFVAFTDPTNPLLYEYVLGDYEDLLQLDVKSMVSNRAADPANLRAEKLFLVCANGKRDQCCALYGPELYQVMTAEDGDNVWQSSHIGGHNKAPVNLFFPHGVHYGQIPTDKIGAVMEEYQNGNVVMDFYRGRVCYQPQFQAAEHLWREGSGITSLPGMQIGSVEVFGENEWEIEVSPLDGGEANRLTIVREFSDFEIPSTCSGSKSAHIPTFRLKR